MDELVSALKKRADPEGVKEIPIRKIGNHRIEIILPQASDAEVEEVKKMLVDVGALEFRILANRKHDEDAMTRALGPGGLAKPPSRYRWARLGEISTGTNPTITSETLTDLQQTWKKDLYAGTEVYLTGKDSLGNETTEAIRVRRNTANTLYLDKPHTLEVGRVLSHRVQPQPDSRRRPQPARSQRRDHSRGEGRARPDRNLDPLQPRPARPGGDRQVPAAGPARLRRAAPARRPLRVQPARGSTVRHAHPRALPEEGDKFKYQLAILLDNLVMSAPVINSEIRDSGIIEGGPQGFKAKEVEHLINVLRAGSLPASLNPTPLQEEKVGPTLGEDTIAKGIRAIWVSMLVVPIFMLVYYRFAGLVATLALVVNMILLIGSMAFMQATFSLPGLAGLALTIGMAVDANVLVFERMREEKERGASLAQQIRNGFNRAWVTIFDSHVTNFLAAVVLYMVGTEEVKGFALTMMIGMAWNLFTAVFMSRVIFEFFYSKGWLKDVTMLKMMGKTNIDFIGPRYICMAGSLILIVLGLIATYIRGPSMFNIDFTGGTLVTIRLNEDDPGVKALAGSESKLAEMVRDEGQGPPRRDGREPASDRGQEPRPVQHPHDRSGSRARSRRRSWRPSRSSLARVEMTADEGKPIAGAAADAGKTRAGADARDSRAGASTSSSSTRPRSIARNSPPRRSSRPNSPRSSPRIRSPIPRRASRSSWHRRPTRRATSKGATATGTRLVLRTDLEPDVAKQELAKLKDSLANNRDLLFERIVNFGSTVAGETRNLALVATVASWLIIIAYLWWRFHSFTYGFAAVLAVVHDVLVTLGAIAVSYWLAMIPWVSTFFQIDQFKIDLPIVAAFLTLIGFSVNDTIVIFDRIREIKGKTPNLSNKMVNDAINQTLSRTILTSFTAWLVVVILYFFGGEGLHGFSFALVVGFLSGTYSTVYIATPILIDFEATKPGPPAKVGKKMAAVKS